MNTKSENNFTSLRKKQIDNYILSKRPLQKADIRFIINYLDLNIPQDQQIDLIEFSNNVKKYIFLKTLFNLV